MDLTDGGASDGFLFTIEFADALVDYELFFNDLSIGGTDTATGTLPTGITGNGDAQDFFIPFSDFSGVDFTSGGQIKLRFTPNNGVLGADLTISDFRTGVVPEPSSLALLGLGGLLLARRRRG